MRLSDVKGDRTLDVIADIIDPIANIAEDKKAVDLFIRKKLPEGITTKQFLLKRARECVPALLKDHKADIISILSAIEGTSTEEYSGRLDLAKLFKDCWDLFTDEAFIDFFTFPQNEGGEDLSGSASGDTPVEA